MTSRENNRFILDFTHCLPILVCITWPCSKCSDKLTQMDLIVLSENVLLANNKYNNKCSFISNLEIKLQ